MSSEPNNHQYTSESQRFHEISSQCFGSELWGLLQLPDCVRRQAPVPDSSPLQETSKNDKSAPDSCLDSNRIDCSPQNLNHHLETTTCRSSELLVRAGVVVLCGRCQGRKTTLPIPTGKATCAFFSFVLGPELRIQCTYTYVNIAEHHRFRIRYAYPALFARFSSCNRYEYTYMKKILVNECEVNKYIYVKKSPGISKSNYSRWDGTLDFMARFLTEVQSARMLGSRTVSPHQRGGGQENRLFGTVVHDPNGS